MTTDSQLEKMILERNTFEAENIKLKKELGDMCKALKDSFNGGWCKEHQRDIDVVARAIIRKYEKYV